MNPYHILLVEDEADLLEHNRRRLQAEGYRVSGTRTLREAERSAKDDPPDLIVLDIQLPDGSGLDFCRDLRAYFQAPVIFLTNMVGKQRIVEGLRAGGDDYLEKPFSMEELLARIEAQLRRAAMLQRTETRLTQGTLELDLIRQQAYFGGKDLLLKPKEFQLLALLIRNRNRYATAGELYTGVWGQAATDSRTVAAHISMLRLRLRDAPFVIEHERSRGYRLTLLEQERKT